MTIQRRLLRFDEVQEILGCGRQTVYDLLSRGHLRAHNPKGMPGTRGTKIIAASVDEYLDAGEIPADKWCE